MIHSICAFTNDIHNWGGGYIVVGVKEQNAVPVLPSAGMNLHALDDIQKELVNLNLIKKNSTISQEQMSLKAGVTIKTIQRDLKAMNHIVQRVSGDNGGHWEIIK